MKVKYKESITVMIVIIMFLLFIIGNLLLDGIEERLKNNENFQRTKCIQNELFYRENKDYVKQNKKCAIINNEPYIYNNVNLERAY